MTCPGQPGQEVVEAGCDLDPTRGRAHFDARRTHLSVPRAAAGRAWGTQGFWALQPARAGRTREWAGLAS